MQNILIIGRGLAGSILSLRLHEQGLKHDIIDLPSLSSSSKVAAGLVNPIVLKRLKLVKAAHEFLAEALPFYKKWEHRLSENFYHNIPIKHILQDAGEANLWMEKSDNPDYAPFLGPIYTEGHPNLPAKNGLGLVKNTGWLDTITFLDAHLRFHQTAGDYREQEINQQDLDDLSQNYDKVIISTGHLMRNLLPQTQNAFSPTRGELMIIESNDLPEDAIYHGPVFILPLGDQKFKVGATYHWDQLTDTATNEGLNQLRQNLEKIFTGDYKVIKHQAGVRPNIKDRKPLIGTVRHRLYSFNGMGSRAVLMAPYLADLLLRHLFEGKHIPIDYDVRRFQ